MTTDAPPPPLRASDSRGSSAASSTSIAILFYLGCALAPATLSYAQGPLTPPGPPAPSMQTLDQLGAKADQGNTKLDQVSTSLIQADTKLDQIDSKTEKRLPITQASLPVTINAPGSYYLAENVTVTGGTAITVNAGGVSLDLNGFTIASSASPASGDGIHLNDTAHDVSISNGHILGGITYNGSFSAGPGFANAIRGPGAGSNSTSILVRNITVSGCGSGILVFADASTSVQHCAVSTVGGEGIDAETVTDSSVFRSGGNGILATTAQNCSARSVVSGTGLIAINAINCFGQSTSGTGLNASSNASNCVGMTTSGTYGLFAGATASFCRGTNSSAAIGLNAAIAIGCTGSAGSGGAPINAPSKYLMP